MTIGALAEITIWEQSSGASGGVEVFVSSYSGLSQWVSACVDHDEAAQTLSGEWLMRVSNDGSQSCCGRDHSSPRSFTWVSVSVLKIKIVGGRLAAASDRRVGVVEYGAWSWSCLGVWCQTRVRPFMMGMEFTILLPACPSRVCCLALLYYDCSHNSTARLDCLSPLYCAVVIQLSVDVAARSSRQCG